MQGLARVDFFVRASDGEVVVNELNTMPGFTATSVYANLVRGVGLVVRSVARQLIELALERHERARASSSRLCPQAMPSRLPERDQLLALPRPRSPG